MKKLLLMLFFAVPYVVAEQQPRFNTLEERFVDVKIKRRKVNRELSKIKEFKNTVCNHEILCRSDLCSWLKSKVEELQKIIDACDDEIIEFEALQKKK
jgi:hypothetical protein